MGWGGKKGSDVQTREHGRERSSRMLSERHTHSDIASIRACFSTQDQLALQYGLTQRRRLLGQAKFVPRCADTGPLCAESPRVQTLLKRGDRTDTRAHPLAGFCWAFSCVDFLTLSNPTFPQRFCGNRAQTLRSLNRGSACRVAIICALHCGGNADGLRQGLQQGEGRIYAMTDPRYLSPGCSGPGR